jgi:hypothetical protein
MLPCTRKRNKLLAAPGKFESKRFCSDQALPTLDTFLKQTKEARIFRRAQAVRAVVQGHRLQTVSDALHFTYAALRQWGHRFANQEGQGLVDRPRPGRPPKCPARWRTTSIGSSTKIPSSTAPAIPSGVVRNLPLFSPSRPASNSAARVHDA